MITTLKNNMSHAVYFENRQHRINAFLATVLPDPSLMPTHLHEAMRYVVLNGGKRIRALLVYATGEALGADPILLDYPASAIELIHTYSLVHDDLPAMDNDDLRRGKPACHKAFDEATAILVGDALQSLAFAILADSELLTLNMRLAMISSLATAAGSQGMAGGQALDLQATGQHLTLHQLETMHHLKTGALIRACVQLGVISSNVADHRMSDTLLTFAYFLGLCFQIQDDILDAVGNTQTLGKPSGSDRSKQKTTFATCNGLADAKHRLTLYHQQAIQALQPLGSRASMLIAIANYIVTRDH